MNYFVTLPCLTARDHDGRLPTNGGMKAKRHVSLINRK